ncbi:RE1-silencing transcription factor-like isoform X4 [Bombyx mandarina]|uniref:RE1-silencing transcription factor-like isoform X4 n=1 Tax=Bombyx mandarina TaxID=7092 RepID=A0A6J2KD69_BOMMA|nr:RE1-silencing transcription factor-like isoform X4 [Bombyx mandarina]
MDSRKESLSTLKICRFCLSQDETLLTNLYEKNRAPKNAITLQLKILSCVAIEVFPSDKMPPYICTRCKFFMDLNFEFKRICRSADENILQFIQNGTTLESLNWPPSLKKIFQLKSKGKVPAEVPVMKTVIEGGATVQVSTQDLSDTDMEDDENVYNIKIGDGPDDESNSARIKVITTDNSKEKTKSSNKGYSSITKLTRHVRTHAGQRSYPCKFCNKSFVKSHHYTRHLRAKHASQSASRAEPEEQFRCEQCDDAFSTQDDLIYHSAIHATQNLICPLCQEKFDDVDAVTAHIKSHVNGLEFMCDYCELIFTEREKLDNHVATVHDEEIISEVGQDDSSIEMDAEDAEEEDDDNPINLTEENGEMVVEIKKAENFMLDTYKGEADPGVTVDNTEHNSEDSEIEMTFTDMSRVDPVTGPIKDELSEKQPSPPSAEPVTLKLNEQSTEKCESQTARILRKAEEVKRKTQSKIDAPQEKKDKPNNNNKVESSTPVGASDKSLRLLEKELQDLKRTNTRSEPFKTSTKPLESLRSRRPQIHTSTPKTRPADEKKPQLVQSKLTLIDKKIQEKRALTKENKEPKEAKDIKNNSNAKDEKEVKEVIKDKTGSKNGTSEKREDGPVRRSARPSKIRDYAKMIRDNSQNSDFSNEDSDNDDSDDNEFKETEIPPETRMKQRRASVKPVVVAKQAQTSSEPTPTPPRKRGRPRKDSKLPPKIKKEDKAETKIEQVNLEKSQKDSDSSKLDKVTSEKEDGSKSDLTDSESGKPNSDQNAPGGVLVSPTTGQTLKKVPIKALPPGVKPLPLLANTRLGSGEVCEMQIGKKLVKVQKIVMTKAEVEAMAKKGLVEMKDGTMVLKQGIKIPTADNNTLKSTSIGEGYEASKESPKKERGAPTRCDIGDDSLK